MNRQNEEQLGLLMMAFERDQHKDGERGVLPCDTDMKVVHLPKYTQDITRVLKYLGKATAKEIADRMKELLIPVTTNQVGTYLVTLEKRGVVSKIEAVPRDYETGVNSTWIFEVVEKPTLIGTDP